MSDFRKLTDTLSVSPQISLDDIDAAAAAGFKTVICNRPDAEEPGQLPLADITAKLAEKGIAFIHQPIVSGQMSPADGAAFGNHIAAAEGPILAYCRSGTRCSFLWALSQAGSMPANEIIETAAAAGYDVSPIARALR